MEITQASKQEVTLLQQRTIKVGRSYSISASQGYLGITEGTVTVSDIIHEPTEPTTDVDCDVHSLISVFIEAETSGTSGEYTRARYRELTSVPWVLYHYLYDKDEHGQYYAMPIDMFIEHTSLR